MKVKSPIQLLWDQLGLKFANKGIEANVEKQTTQKEFVSDLQD